MVDRKGENGTRDPDGCVASKDCWHTQDEALQGPTLAGWIPCKAPCHPVCRPATRAPTFSFLPLSRALSFTGFSERHAQGTESLTIAALPAGSYGGEKLSFQLVKKVSL